MADLIFYAADLDTNQQVVVPQADMPPAPPSGAAGGGLSGSYPNPTVAAVPDSALGPNVPLMTAGVLPAVDGSLLTNLPAPAVGDTGTVACGVTALDGSGIAVLTAGSNFPNPASQCVFVFSVQDAVGPFTAIPTGGPGAPIGPGDSVTITSALGAGDSGKAISWIVGYQ